MRKSAVDLIGADRLLDLNAMGNRRISEVQNASQNFSEANRDGDKMVNVYMVAEKPKTLTSNDVVMAASEDIQKGGQLKKLIKSINMGAL